MVENNNQVKHVWESLLFDLRSWKNDAPNPLAIIHYEGLLDMDPLRVETVESLQDMNKIAGFLFAYYITQDDIYKQKLKEFILSWTSTYEPTGNPINENKFEPLLHSYFVIQSAFTQSEVEQVNQWLNKIAEKQMKYRIPGNNWMAKHLKMMNLIGLICQMKTS